MKNLHEWKHAKLAELRMEVKGQMREGIEITEHFAFTEDELRMFEEEVEIESYSELFEDWEVVSLEDDELQESSEPQDYFDFIPSESGSRMDVEAELDLNKYEIDEDVLDKIASLFFAEEVEYEVIEEGLRAKIIFKRSKGEVYKKKKCAKGMRLMGNRCLPQTGTQRGEERRRGIKLKRAFKAMGAGKKKKAQIKKKITKRRIKGRQRNLANTEN